MESSSEFFDTCKKKTNNYKLTIVKTAKNQFFSPKKLKNWPKILIINSICCKIILITYWRAYCVWTELHILKINISERRESLEIWLKYLQFSTFFIQKWFNVQFANCWEAFEIVTMHHLLTLVDQQGYHVRTIPEFIIQLPKKTLIATKFTSQWRKLISWDHGQVY